MPYLTWDHEDSQEGLTLSSISLHSAYSKKPLIIAILNNNPIVHRTSQYLVGMLNITSPGASPFISINFLDFNGTIPLLPRGTCLAIRGCYIKLSTRNHPCYGHNASLVVPNHALVTILPPISHDIILFSLFPPTVFDHEYINIGLYNKIGKVVVVNLSLHGVYYDHNNLGIDCRKIHLSDSSSKDFYIHVLPPYYHLYDDLHSGDIINLHYLEVRAPTPQHGRTFHFTPLTYCTHVAFV